MSDRPARAQRGVAPGQVAEIIVSLPGDAGRRGSGYRVGPTAVLTAAHVVAGAASVRVRLDADLPGEWSAEVTSCWTDPGSDLAVLSIAARDGESPVSVARFGRIGGHRAAVLVARTVGFPRFKLKSDDDDGTVYRDSHQADGSVAVLSNRRERTLEVTVAPPERDPDPDTSRWEGMSGAALWIGGRIVGVIAKHHRGDGLGRLAAARVDLALEALDQARRDELRALLGLPEVLPDVIPPSAGEWVTSAYQAQVRDIAPDQLLDRDEELDDLVRFCAGNQPYAWWQAGPWAGKSALMSWFVLHPPAGVDVVSFFVTARLAGQSDSDACTEALIEQLAALVSESPTGLLSAGPRRGTMLKLLEDAASRSREAGRRLLLVIDGLDEDSGTGSSIAALLPRRPPPEVRVLIASRPHPGIPDDVADDHPLRTISPRQLDVAEQARDIERRAKHELKQLLAGSPLQRDVLGLITAAGGGLTLAELEELTKRSPYEIEHLLGGLFGRSVGSRISSLSAGSQPAEPVYLFTHETLRLVAEQQFGTSLAAYRDQLHTWADAYRQQGWPPATPQYLLRSYPRMLASTGSLAQLVALATDPVRHDRMRDLTGGDALAVAEISTAQQLILAQPDPHLTGLALLAVQRDHLTTRNSNIPIELPAVWAMLGQPSRAEAIAKGLPDPAKRASALTQLARVASFGDHNRASRLLDEAEALVVQISDPNLRARVLAGLAGEMAAGGNRGRAEALVAEITSTGLRAGVLTRLAEVATAGGEHERAETLVAEISDPGLRAGALAWLALAAATGGEHDLAVRLTSAAEALTTQLTGSLRAEVLARLTRVATTEGDHDRAGGLLDEAEGLVEDVVGEGRRAREIGRLARTAAAIGDRDRAARLLDEAERRLAQISGQPHYAEGLARLASTAAAAGDHERGEALLTDVTEPELRAEALARLALAAAAVGARDRAARLVDMAEQLVTQISDPSQRAHELARLAEGVAVVGDHERAEGLISQIADPSLQARALARLVLAGTVLGDHGETEALVRRISEPTLRPEELGRLPGEVEAGGDLDEAETLVAQLSAPDQRARALARLAEAAAAGGDYDRATRLAAEAEDLAEHVGDPFAQEGFLGRLARVAAAGGNHDKAAALIAQIRSPGSQVRVLALLARRAAADGDRDRAARLINDAELLIEQVNMLSGWHFLARLAEAAAISGDHDRAEALTEQITGPGEREEVVGQLAGVVAACGDDDRAKALLARIANPNRRASALARAAAALVETSQETPPTREHVHSRSAVMVRARRLVAEALVTSSWTEVVASLARVDPLAVRALADELQLRWGSQPS